jgi:hypothetical protein
VHKHGYYRLPTNWPFPPDNRFKGRVDELNKLKTSLQGEEKVHTSAVTGPGGVGKTSLVLQYAYTSKDLHSFIIWINAKSKLSVEDGFIWVLGHIVRIMAEDAPQGKPDFSKISRDLNITGLISPEGKLQIAEDNQDQRDQAVQAVLLWLTAQPDHSWLVIFDEHDTLDFRLRDFIAKCSWGQYIITSRRPEVREYATDRFELGGLEPEDALQLLLSGSERDGKESEGTVGQPK